MNEPSSLTGSFTTSHCTPRLAMNHVACAAESGKLIVGSFMCKSILRRISARKLATVFVIAILTVVMSIMALSAWIQFHMILPSADNVQGITVRFFGKDPNGASIADPDTPHPIHGMVPMVEFRVPTDQIKGVLEGLSPAYRDRSGLGVSGIIAEMVVQCKSGDQVEVTWFASREDEAGRITVGPEQVRAGRTRSIREALRRAYNASLSQP